MQLLNSVVCPSSLPTVRMSSVHLSYYDIPATTQKSPRNGQSPPPQSTHIPGLLSDDIDNFTSINPERYNCSTFEVFTMDEIDTLLEEPNTWACEIKLDLAASPEGVTQSFRLSQLFSNSQNRVRSPSTDVYWLPGCTSPCGKEVKRLLHEQAGKAGFSFALTGTRKTNFGKVAKFQCYRGQLAREAQVSSSTFNV